MADISKIKVPNDSTIYDVYDTVAVTSLKTVNNTSLEGSGNITVSENRKVWYGVCTTDSGTSPKEVDTYTTGSGSFTYSNGNVLKIKFTYGNTTLNPTMKISGSTTSYSIRTLGTSTVYSNLWQAGETIELVYYSSYFYITHNPMQGSSYPGLSSVKLLDSYTSTGLQSIPTAAALKNVYDKLDTRLAETSPTQFVLTPNSTYFQLYNSNKSIKLLYWNGIADLTGIVKPTQTITGSDTQYTICTIPTGYRPYIGLVEPMQASGQGLWMCRVHGTNDGDDGYVTFSRHRTADSWANVTTSTWLPFHMMWVVSE